MIVHELEDVPGSAGAALRRIADAGANLQLVYMATGTRLVLGVDDLEAARGRPRSGRRNVDCAAGPRCSPRERRPRSRP